MKRVQVPPLTEKQLVELEELYHKTKTPRLRTRAQVERFAPGFRERILARHTMSAVGMEAYNPNYIGGDIIGGVADIWQIFTRPAIRWTPYTTRLKWVFICSSSTPPGGVHGMCGYYAAQAVLRSK